MEANTNTSPTHPLHPILAGLLGGAPVVPASNTGSGDAADREAADGANAASSPEPANETPKVVSEHYRKRYETQVVKTYLNDLNNNGATTGYSLRSLEARLAQIEKALDNQKDPLRRVYLAQKRIDLIKQVRKARQMEAAKDNEAEFIKVLKSFSDRKGYTYSAWRAVGVPAHVLRDAGLKRSRVDSINGRQSASK